MRLSGARRLERLEKQKGSVFEVAVLGVVVSLLVNIRALFCGFSPTDDYLYVVNNELIRNSFQTNTTTSDVYQFMISLRYSFN